MTSDPAFASAGFSLVEVLVALAIAAGLMLGIGTLVGSVANLNDQASAADAIINALIDLDGISRVIALADPKELVAAGVDSFVFDSGVAGRIDRVDATATLEFDIPSAATRVDVSMFDAVSLEYLLPTSAALWSAAPRNMTDTAGVRLVLVAGVRIWRPLLWLRGRFAS